MEKPQTSTYIHEDVRATKKPKFIVDWNEDEDEDGDKLKTEEESLFSVCAICDDGGELLFCEGKCLRSFHATIDDGDGSACESLGYTKAQVDAVPTFWCANCKHQQHQCFSCGKLGSSDNSSCQEVFPCISARCGHFYHPECVTKLLHPDNGSLAEEFQERVAAGESFTCPVHNCFVCKQSEDINVDDLQFAMCRRCPKAYHRKCLPRGITFENTDNSLQRAWEGLLPNKRILIFCLEHKINRELMAPARDHIIFPEVEGERRTKALGRLPKKEMHVVSKRSMVSERFDTDRTVVKKPKLFEETANKGKPFFRKDFSLGKSKSYVVEPEQQIIGGSKMKKTTLHKPLVETVNGSQPSVDAKMEKRILDLIKDSTSSFNEEEFLKRQNVPATRTYHSKSVLDKNITQGFVEGSLKAVQMALQNIEKGCRIEDAKAICDPQMLKQIIVWKRKLDNYLAPFLHGMRYTSFGRHFTKKEKLQEIVNRLHWYVQSGDMIVDFCCGSNDFSCLLKEKVEQTGKSCSFKNYDLFQPKNDFSFEKRDWMSVKPEELPDGSRLIMGLNPPFGVKASRANQFIKHALKFNPKLIVLIVPEEAKQLDAETDEKGRPRYNLIWVNGEMLSGKSFYLPGSVDVNDNQMDQWNLKAPPLFLWSRNDWTGRHKAVALRQGHP